MSQIDEKLVFILRCYRLRFDITNPMAYSYSEDDQNYNQQFKHGVSIFLSFRKKVKTPNQRKPKVKSERLNIPKPFCLLKKLTAAALEQNMEISKEADIRTTHLPRFAS